MTMLVLLVSVPLLMAECKDAQQSSRNRLPKSGLGADTGFRMRP